MTAAYVNALGITASSILIKNTDGYTLFSASGNTVNIGNFTVGRTSSKSYLYSGSKTSYSSSTTGVYLGSDGIGLGAGKFYVTSAGALTAKSGTIGNFKLNDTSLYTNNFSYWTEGSTSLEGIYLGEEGIQFKNTDGESNSCRFWINQYGTMCIEKGAAGTGVFFSFDFDGLHIHNGLSMTDDGFADIGIQPGFIQIYTKSSSGNGMSVIPIRFDALNKNYFLNGNWYLNNTSVAVTSWRGAKKNIEPLSEKYSILFDNLIASRFIYEEGESGRYHTGFILDEMKDAMDIAELDSMEVAAYCVIDKDTGRGGIRYEEIIPINVWETQKLKSRVAELETQIKNLLLEIASLKQQ